jgi:hypothetical protein
MAVATVAERLVLAVFAVTKGNGFRLGEFEFQWSQAGSFVGAITKRLILRSPATAPEIGSGFQFQYGWLLVENHWLSHGI